MIEIRLQVDETFKEPRKTKQLPKVPQRPLFGGPPHLLGFFFSRRMSKSTRAPPRAGGAALQLEILALSTLLDSSGLSDGRLRAGVEDMMQRAVRPEREASAAAASVTPADEPRLREYARIRAYLSAGGGDAGAAAAAMIPSARGPASGPDGAVWSPWIAPITGGGATPDIPLFLSLPRCDAGAAGAEVLASLLPAAAFSRLVYCDLSGNTLTDLGEDTRGWAMLSAAIAKHARSLVFLSVANNALLAAGGAAAARLLCGARGLSSLTHLDLSRANLGAAGAATLLSAFGGSSAAPTAGASPDVAPAAPADGGDVGLLAGEHSSVETMAVFELQRAADVAAFAAAKAAFAGEGSGGVGADSPVVARNTSLRWLDLSENNLTDGGAAPGPAAALCAALLAIPALRHVNLSRNRLGVGRGARPLVALEIGLKNNGTLESLCLDENDVDAAPLAALLSALAGNSTSAISALSIAGNRGRSTGASAVAAALRAQAARAHPPLKYVDLRDNYVGDVGRADIVLALRGEPPPPEVADEDKPLPPIQRPRSESEEWEAEESAAAAAAAGVSADSSSRTSTSVESICSELAAALATVTSTDEVQVLGSDYDGTPDPALRSESAASEGSTIGDRESDRASPPPPPTLASPVRSAGGTGARAVLALREAASGDAAGGTALVGGAVADSAPPAPSVRIVALASPISARPGFAATAAQDIAYVAIVDDTSGRRVLL